MKLFLDCETYARPLPADQADAYVRAAVPGNYKRPEKIAEWCDENRREVLGKRALDPLALELAAIAVAVNDGPVTCWAGPDPRKILRDFADWIWGSLGVGFARAATLIGHNVQTFDLPNIRRQAARLGVGELLTWLPGERYDRRVHDTLSLWSAPGDRAWITLDELAAFLGLPARATNGADIAGLVDAGDWAGVATHCTADVELVRQVYARLSPTPITAAAAPQELAR